MKNQPETFTLPLYGGREGNGTFRLMTLEEAKNLRGEFWFIAKDKSARRARVTGAVQRWKRTPDRIRVPAKYGMYEPFALSERDVGPMGWVLVRLG